MKRIVLTMLLFLSEGIFCQTGITIELSNTYFPSINYKDYDITSIGLGINVNLKKGKLKALLNYGYSYEGMFNNYYYPKLKSHLIGCKIEYKILNRKEKKIDPFIGLQIQSEISSNYRDGFMSVDNFHSVKSVGGFVSNYKVILHSNFYQSTPFIGSVNGGCSIRLVDNLHLNVAVGYGLMVMKYKYLEWEKGSDYKELLKNIPAKTKNFNYVDFQLGLSYTFSFKKSKSN